MNLTLCVMLPLGLAVGHDDPAKSSIEEARAVVAAIVKAAEENAAKEKGKLDGDALADYYVRRAAAAAADGGLSAKAFLLGLGVALDDSDLLRKNVVLRGTLAKVESDREREKRLKVIGKPTLRGRHDWVLHFSISAGLTGQLGPALAEQIGLEKEFLDMRPGGSGFSFGDLAADYAGVAFASRLLEKDADAKKLLAALAEGFKGDDFLPKVDDLEEGLSKAKLEEKYGKGDDPRFLKQCEGVRERVKRAPGLKPPE
jgi:hypothetical protein